MTGTKRGLPEDYPTAGLGPSTEGEMVEYTNGPIDTRLARTQIGWWGQYRLPLGSRMALEPGVRLDWNSFTSEALWQPRVRLSGRVRSSNWWIGYAEQAQTPSHESLQGYDYVQLTAADGGRLKSERSRQIVAGVERTLSGDFALRIEAYGRRFDRLLVQRLETDAERALRLSRLWDSARSAGGQYGSTNIARRSSRTASVADRARASRCSSNARPVW